MDGVTITLVLVLLVYAACVDWKELSGVLKEGGWFAVFFYVLLGIALVMLVQGAIG